jgi:hypothetical protein
MSTPQSIAMLRRQGAAQENPWRVRHVQGIPIIIAIIIITIIIVAINNSGSLEGR